MELARVLGTVVVVSALGLGCGTDSLAPVKSAPIDELSEPPPADPPPSDPPPSDPPPIDPPPIDPPPSDPPPEDPPPSDPPVQASGDWQTQYHLDWSAYLGYLEGMGEPIDTLDQVLTGNLDIPLLDGLVSDYLRDFTPEWVAGLVHILNNVVHFFEDVEITALLTLEDATPTLLRATEAWTLGAVHVITMCPQGELTPGYPDCARIEVPLAPLDEEYAYVAVDPQPFEASLAPGEPMRVSDREVRMQLARFVAYVVDELVYWSTDGEHDSLASALDALVDCAALRAATEDATGLSWPEVEMACTFAVAVVSDDVLTQLDATYDWEVMRFSQTAAAIDDDGDDVVDHLGTPTMPGAVHDGEFELLRNAVLTGSWSGERL
jgi:hypothetical protein